MTVARLTVVTHTRGDRPELLRQCCASVEEHLPAGAQHKVIKLDSGNDLYTWASARLDSLLLDEVVAYVDDDDYLVNDSLRVAYEAMCATKAGLVFTGERMVDLHGKSMYDSDIVAPKFSSSIACHPNVAHHLCLIRTDCVASQCWTHTRDYGPAIEWMIKGSAALSSGSAVFVPLIGYCWRQHPSSLSKSSFWRKPYTAELFNKVSTDLASMISKDKQFPMYTSPSLAISSNVTT